MHEGPTAGIREAGGPPLARLTDTREVTMASPAARLLGFLLLLAVMFAGAYAAGARLGPLQLTHPPSSPGGTMHMNMGAGPARSRTLPLDGRR
jgi:hypothetical protein